jgi:hypothetical protein
MKVLVDVKDNKADFVLELLRSLSFVKAKPLTSRKAEILAGIKESVDEVKRIKSGKLKGRKAEDLLHEL